MARWGDGVPGVPGKYVKRGRQVRRTGSLSKTIGMEKLKKWRRKALPKIKKIGKYAGKKP